MYRKSNMLEGYITERRELVYTDSIEYEIQYFQGEHENEYLVSELKNGKPNGRCQLFKDGILEQSWVQKDGNYVGGFTVYEEGKAVYYRHWSNVLERKEIRVVENDKSKPVLVIRDRNTSTVLYRGEFDKESMNRHGKGIVYDSNGCLLHYGVFQNDELFQIFQRFEKDVMITYAVEEGVSNVGLKDRHPVYRGGFLFDEATSQFVPHGKGCAFDKATGMMIAEGVWEKGEVKEQQELQRGWYATGMEDECLLTLIQKASQGVSVAREEVGEAEEEVEENHYCIHEVKWLIGHIPAKLTQLTVDDATCNDKAITTLSLQSFAFLRTITIGNECFQFVGKVELEGLARLESVAIGTNCFTESKNSCGMKSKQLTVRNCPRLASLSIGSFSFSDYKQFTVSNLPALRSLQIGAPAVDSSNFYWADFALQDFPSLETVTLGYYSFYASLHTRLENMPLLQSIHLGPFSLCGSDYQRKNDLVLKNLPALRSITAGEACFYNPRSVTIQNVPNVDKLDFSSKEYSAFYHVNSILMKDAGAFESYPGLVKKK